MRCYGGDTPCWPIRPPTPIRWRSPSSSSWTRAVRPRPGPRVCGASPSTRRPSSATGSPRLRPSSAWTRPSSSGGTSCATAPRRVLGKQEAFTFFRRVLNYDPVRADSVRLREDALLDYDVCDATLECHRTHLRLDDAYVRVLTLKEPPSQTFPHLFQP